MNSDPNSNRISDPESNPDRPLMKIASHDQDMDPALQLLRSETNIFETEIDQTFDRIVFNLKLRLESEATVEFWVFTHEKPLVMHNQRLRFEGKIRDYLVSTSFQTFPIKFCDSFLKESEIFNQARLGFEDRMAFDYLKTKLHDEKNLEAFLKICETAQKKFNITDLQLSDLLTKTLSEQKIRSLSKNNQIMKGIRLIINELNSSELKINKINENTFKIWQELMIYSPFGFHYLKYVIHAFFLYLFAILLISFAFNFKNPPPEAFYLSLICGPILKWALDNLINQLRYHYKIRMRKIVASSLIKVFVLLRTGWAALARGLVSLNSSLPFFSKLSHRVGLILISLMALVISFHMPLMGSWLLQGFGIILLLLSLKPKDLFLKLVQSAIGGTFTFWVLNDIGLTSPGMGGFHIALLSFMMVSSLFAKVDRMIEHSIILKKLKFLSGLVHYLRNLFFMIALIGILLLILRLIQETFHLAF